MDLQRTQVLLAPGDSVRLGERHQVKVSVDLPQVLYVTDHGGVAVVDGLPESEGWLDASQRVTIPARGVPELNIPQSEDLESSLDQPVRRLAVRGRVQSSRLRQESD